MGFHNTSYDSHTKHLLESAKDQSKLKFGKNTVNRWRQERSYRNIDPLFIIFPEAKWLTVGDFYYGSDAQYIQSKGIDVTASELDDLLLKEAYNDGDLKKFSKQNAESLTFGDNEFDFTLCKETLHHLPRPFVGLYEILRVSQKGIALIEPYDRQINASFAERIGLWLLKKLKGPLHDKYEPVGNFKYGYSVREFEKVALGLNYGILAYKFMNDYYSEGLRIETAPLGGKVHKFVKRKILFRDILWKFRLFPPTFIIAIILKNKCDTSALVKNGFTILHLTKNPYL